MITRDGPVVIHLLSMIGPLLMLFTGVVLTTAAFGTAWSIPLTPLFPIAVIFYWGLTRPEALPSIGVFAAGLMHDLLSGGPLGVWAFVYVLALMSVVSVRPYFVGRAALPVWGAFLFMGAAAAFGLWAITSVYYWTMMDPLPIFGQLALTIFVYPLLARLFGLVERASRPTPV